MQPISLNKKYFLNKEKKVDIKKNFDEFKINLTETYHS